MKTKFKYIAFMAALLPSFGLGCSLSQPVTNAIKAEGAAISITNEDELVNFFSTGGSGILYSEIEVSTPGGNLKTFAPNSKDVTLDLNGYKIVSTGTYNSSEDRFLFKLTGNSNVHIVDSSSNKTGSIVQETGENLFGVYGSSKLVLDNVTIKHDGTCRSEKHAISIFDSADVTLNNSSINDYNKGFRLLGENSKCTLIDAEINDNNTGGEFAINSNSYLYLGKGTTITDNADEFTNYASNLVLDITNSSASDAKDHIVFMDGDNAPTEGMKIGLTPKKCDLITTSTDIRSRFTIDDKMILTYTDGVIHADNLIFKTEPTASSNYKVETNSAAVDYQWSTIEEITVDITNANYLSLFDDASGFHDVDDYFKSAYRGYIAVLNFDYSELKDFKLEFSTDVDVILDSGDVTLSGDKEKYALTFLNGSKYFCIYSETSDFTISDMKFKYTGYVPITEDWVTADTLDLTKVSSLLDKTIVCVAIDKNNPNAKTISREINFVKYSLVNVETSLDCYAENNAQISLPDNPFEVPEGKVFAGWSLTSNGDLIEDENVAITDGKKLYVIWGDAHSHSGSKVNGTEATCENQGTKDYYQCGCGKYFADSECTNEITDLEAWKIGDGKTNPLGHAMTKHDAVEATADAAGRKEYYECSNCGEFYEDNSATKKISNLSAWKAKNGGGYVEKLPTVTPTTPTTPSTPSAKAECSLLWLWILLPILLILIVIYLIGYFAFYRKGRLDNKAIRVIYKILPRGKREEK